jgi:hypothetical protein
VSLAVLVASVYVAVMTATPVTEVAAVWTSNVPEVDPEAIVMDAGTVASEVSLLDSVTKTPSEGAAAVNAIVAVTMFPPATDVEDNEMPESALAVDEGEDGDPPHPTYSGTTNSSRRIRACTAGRACKAVASSTFGLCHGVAIDAGDSAMQIEDNATSIGDTQINMV